MSCIVVICYPYVVPVIIFGMIVQRFLKIIVTICDFFILLNESCAEFTQPHVNINCIEFHKYSDL